MHSEYGTAFYQRTLAAAGFLAALVVLSSVKPANADLLRSYSDQLICSMAVDTVNGSKKWKSTTVALKYKSEARRRALSCLSTKVKNSTSQKPNPITPLQKAFDNRQRQKRLLIQTKLNNLGFYYSMIDGLYGKATAAALEAYNKEYLGNADLSKPANTKILMDDLLKERHSETEASEAVAAAEVELEKPKIIEPEPPLDFTQLKASYDAKEFSKAFIDAQVLAVQGDTNAQFYLGKMYADGRGTIQVSTAAHMWFNIASMNGSDEAYQQRKAVTAQMTPSAVEKAQAMAMTCIQSAYTECGLTVKAAENKVEPVAKTVTDVATIKSYFKKQSPLKRKQIQYALKELGVYSSSVDGAWGNRTATAVSNYQNLQEMQSASPSKLYASILSKVKVPSSFSAPKRTAPKKKTVNKPASIDTGGLTSIISNPSMTGTQALAICRPQAELAKSQARSQANSMGGSGRRTYDLDCSFGSCRARDVTPSGGAWGGIARGLSISKAGKRAYSAVLEACLAGYGWR